VEEYSKKILQEAIVHYVELVGLKLDVLRQELKDGKN
jgi:hypothetical protein